MHAFLMFSWILLSGLDPKCCTCLGEGSVSKRAAFGNSYSFGQDERKGSGFKAVSSSSLGRFVASWRPHRPNVFAYVLNVATGS